MASSFAMLFALGAATMSLAQEHLAPPPVDDVGVYFKKDGLWHDLLPEVIDWKTGGVLKHAASLGVVKGDMNGRIAGPSSRTLLPRPVELLVYCPAGVEVTEYQLLRLHEHEKSREFRTVTGGVFHATGGSQRDLLPFDTKKIAQRTWVIELSNLQPGQYGLMPPGAFEARNASAPLGKMYTFAVTE